MATIREEDEEERVPLKVDPAVELFRMIKQIVYFEKEC